MESPFRDASHLLVPNEDELSYGCAMADLDGDGRPEILSVNVAAPNRLYKWRDGKMIDVAPPEFQDIENNGIGLACGDIADSGRPDIYFMNTTAFLGPDSDPDVLLENLGDLRFRNRFADAGASNFGAGRSIAWFDVDGKMRYGAYVCNYAEPCRLFAMENGKLVNLAPRLRLNQTTGGRAAVAADFFGSGRIDLFTGNENDANRLFRNDGGRRFAEVGESLGLADSRQHMRGLMVCDLNRDGRPDLVWGNWEGPHRMMIQQSDGTFKDEAPRHFARPSRVRTVIVFDWDNDGWEDIFVNNMGEANRLFHNNGDGTFTQVDIGDLELADGFGTGACVGDIDGDGFLDLFVSHGESGPQPNALFLNTPNGNNWLRVHAQTPKGAPALGTKVVAFAGGDPRPMLRFIDGGSGYLCQMEQVAHFGLGKAESVDRLEIHFTNGERFEARNLPANRNLVVRRAGDGWFAEELRR